MWSISHSLNIFRFVRVAMYLWAMKEEKVQYSLFTYFKQAVAIPIFDVSIIASDILLPAISIHNSIIGGAAKLLCEGSLNFIEFYESTIRK